MKNDNQHNKLNPEMYFINSLPKIEVTYSKSKEDVWKELSKKTSAPAVPTKVIKMQWLKYAATACILLLLGFTGFINLYTKTIHCPKGEHLSVSLPDQSVVDLNANSSISYKPYWWKFSRKVKFEGEAFFKITKGSKFEIASNYGKTYILGTSFNIYARGNEYKVTCYTGKVKVVSTLTSDKILLLPNDHAFVTRNGKLELKKCPNTENKISWRNNLFLFTKTPLQLVFKEIELQYDINIVEKGKFNLPYTGNFAKEKSVESTLHKVCVPFGLKFIKGPNNNYIITSNAQ
ncbi:MAG: FecR family protein [Labilibaculum sp.]|nr:FecR family protein [Labilibaculum sp.]